MDTSQNEGDIISVRQKGRFIFDGVSHQTKKGPFGCSSQKIRINADQNQSMLKMAFFKEAPNRPH